MLRSSNTGLTWQRLVFGEGRRMTNPYLFIADCPAIWSYFDDANAQRPSRDRVDTAEACRIFMDTSHPWPWALGLVGMRVS